MYNALSKVRWVGTDYVNELKSLFWKFHYLAIHMCENSMNEINQIFFLF